MEVHVFILSTMSREMTAAYFKRYNVPFDPSNVTVQRYRWRRRTAKEALSVSLWLACQHPVVDALASSIVPYMDTSVCLYHDHNAMSCVRVRNAMATLQRHTDSIWLMSTTMPRLRIQHASRIKKCYNRDGFERPLLTGPLHENIEEMIRVDLNVCKYLDSF